MSAMTPQADPTVSLSPKRRGALRGIAAAGAGALVIGLGACGVTTKAGSNGLYAKPIGDAPVTANPTPYTPALLCLADYAARNNLEPPRVAVGRLSDMTGRLDENGGRTVTQGAMLMTISALGKAGIPVVERYETEVPRLEYNFANNKLVADGDARRGRKDYRPVHPGQISGADYFVAGGITELNTDIRTSNLEADTFRRRGPDSVGASAGDSFVLSVAIDLRLIDIESLDVVDIVSYQKQIVGRQVGVGLFAFFGDNVLSVSGGAGAQEPVHLAVRSLLERATVQMVAKLYGAGSEQACVKATSDPLRAAVVVPG